MAAKDYQFSDSLNDILRKILQNQAEIIRGTLSLKVSGAATVVAAPATAASAGTPGQIAYDATHIYICIATNSWIRAVAAAW